MKCLLIALLWVLWCALHSFLIATTVTEYTKKKLGDQFRFYRLFYNTLALVTLIPLIYWSIFIEQAPFFRWEGNLVIVRYFLFAASISLVFAAGRHYSMSELFGIRQIKTGQMNRALSKYNRLDTSGILGAIRHPWYIAGILLVWASDISLSILLINIIISTYFVIGTILEERKLLLEFGEKYREYQENVSMFIPLKWLKAKIAGRSRIGSFQKITSHPPSIPVGNLH